MRILKNRKGFTLIELLAVIVILAILLTMAIPAMNTVMENARKNTYITTAQEYAEQVQINALSGDFDLPGVGGAIVVATKNIELQRASDKSTFSATYDYARCYVVVVNDGETTGDGEVLSDKYIYFVAMRDTKGNGMTLKDETTLVRNDIKKGGITQASISSIDSYSVGGSISAASLGGTSLSRASYTFEYVDTIT